MPIMLRLYRGAKRPESRSKFLKSSNCQSNGVFVANLGHNVRNTVTHGQYTTILSGLRLQYCNLSVFSEIRESQMRRREIFAFLFGTYNNQNNYCNEIREHFEKVLNIDAQIRDIVVNYKKSAEKN